MTNMASIDLTTLTDEASSKVWDEIHGGDADPLHDQSDIVQHSVKSRVLPVILTVVPVVQKAVETSIKEKLIAEINAAHEAGHPAEFTLMALMAQLSDDD